MMRLRVTKQGFMAIEGHSKERVCWMGVCPRQNFWSQLIRYREWHDSGAARTSWGLFQPWVFRDWEVFICLVSKDVCDYRRRWGREETWVFELSEWKTTLKFHRAHERHLYTKTNHSVSWNSWSAGVFGAPVYLFVIVSWLERGCLSEGGVCGRVSKILFWDVGLGPPKPIQLMNKATATAFKEWLWPCWRSGPISITGRG